MDGNIGGREREKEEMKQLGRDRRSECGMQGVDVGGWEDGVEGEGDREGSQRNVP